MELIANQELPEELSCRSAIPAYRYGIPSRTEAYGRLLDMESLKNQAYSERNQLVAALSKLFSSSLERHPDNEAYEDDWRWIVFIDLPGGQVCWHIHDSELGLFDHLPRLVGRKWDGHTREEKYQRIATLQKIVTP